jgi:putative OPT family oligopeptide transporter
MFIFAFFFTAVAGYIAGVVGSSNNPISGVTVATLMFTALMLVGLMAAGAGISSNAGMTATILVAAIVCCSAAIAGDCMQELKTGQLLGSTPRNLQLAEFVGAICSAFFLAPIVIYLHQAYTIGSIDLPAPQAKVMASVVVGVFTGQMNIPMLLLGIGVAFLFIFLEYANIAKISIMAVAIGIYLPLTLTVPIFLGGVVKAVVFSFTEKKVMLESRGKSSKEIEKRMSADLEDADSKGILIASGLVAGEALMGVIIAVLVISGITLTVVPGPIAWPGLLIFLYIGFLLAYLSIREKIGQLSTGQIKRIIVPAFRDLLKQWKK